jgi:hypothetical protein
VALEEPSVSEVIRDVQAAVDRIDERTKRIEDSQSLYVSRELYDTHRAETDRRVTALEDKRQQWWTALALPVMVGVLVVLFGEWVK